MTMFVTCDMLGETNCKYFPDKHAAYGTFQSVSCC